MSEENALNSQLCPKKRKVNLLAKLSHLKAKQGISILKTHQLGHCHQTDYSKAGMMLGVRLSAQTAPSVLLNGTSQTGSHSTRQPFSSCLDWRHSAQNITGTQYVEGSWFLAPCRHGSEQEWCHFWLMQHWILSWASWLVPVTSAPTRLRQEDHKSKTRLGYSQGWPGIQTNTLL